jgi:hypothetical protein
MAFTYYQALDQRNISILKRRTGEEIPTVTDLIKDISFVDATSPNANHILVTFNKELEPCSISIWRNTAQTGGFALAKIEGRV